MLFVSTEQQLPAVTPGYLHTCGSTGNSGTSGIYGSAASGGVAVSSAAADSTVC